MVYAQSVSAFSFSPRSGGKFAVTLHANEEKCVGHLWQEIAALGFDWIRLRKNPSSVLGSWLFFLRVFARNSASLGRVLRFSCRLVRRYPLFVALRGTETVFRYAFFREFIRRNHARAFLVSTDGNPHGRALMAAATVSGVPLIFASHGAVAQYPVPIHCTLALLYGEKARRAHLAPNSYGKALLYGFQELHQQLRALSIPRKILVCLGQSVNLEALTALATKLGAGFPGLRLVVRPHPHSLIAPASLREKGLGAEFSGAGLESDLRDCDLVIAPNSTVHLECLVRGIPTVYLPELDASPQRPLPFLAEGIVFQWEGWSAVDLSISALNLHYQRTGIEEAIGAYMNTTYDHDEFLNRFRRELRDILH